MEEATKVAFAKGDFEGVLDRLSVVSMNTQSKEDGRTPLMAACAHGNKPVMDLLLDLLCSETMKDNAGKTAMDYAQDAGHHHMWKDILQRRRPPLGEDGKPVFTWDTCSHPPENKYLDESIGWLICTGCGLVLKENAIQLSGNDGGNPYKKMAAVRGADAEYNAWRAEELELADIMSQLGVVDNDAALKAGESTSIWAARKQAEAWLDKRMRHIASWKHRAQLARLEGQPIPEFIAFPAYTRGVDYVHQQKLIGDHSMREAPAPTKLPRFRGAVPKPEIPVEEEELLDPGKMWQEKYAYKPTKWRIAIDRWDRVSVGALRWDRQRMLHMARVELEEEEEEEVEEEREVEREVEWELS